MIPWHPVSFTCFSLGVQGLRAWMWKVLLCFCRPCPRPTLVQPPTPPLGCPLPYKSLVLRSVGAQQHRDQPQVSLEGMGTSAGGTFREKPAGTPGIVRRLQEGSGFQVTFVPPPLPTRRGHVERMVWIIC